MKACIATFCTSSSYGSMLQALGLKKALSELGWDSFVIRSAPETPPTLQAPRSLRQLQVFPFDILSLKNRKTVFRKGAEFMREHLDVKEYPDYQRLLDHPPQADAYIAGSDQVWQPQKMDPMMFLDFVKGSKKLSYAASMGVTAADQAVMEKMKRYLADYDALSVREQECVDVLEGLVSLPVSVNIDPSFFMTAQEWRKYEKPYPVKEPYILLYSIYWAPEMKEQIVSLSKKTGLPVYTVRPRRSRAYADRSIYDAGPAEFLWLIDNAEYTVTTSFHGAAFSAIFGKQFSAVSNPKAPSRIDHLLRVLEIPKTEIGALADAQPFDHDKINERIRQEREKGIRYLKEALR